MKFVKFLLYALITLLCIIGALVACGGESSDDETETIEQTQSNQPQQQEINLPDKYAGLTTEQKNAVKSAESYLYYSGFSRTGLIEQLEFEKYSTEAAEFAVDFCDPDWAAEALESAKSYIEYSGFSKNGLIEQLEFEGFTHSQAVYGADFCGADWNEEAAETAKSYMAYSSFSREGLIDQLEFEGFTADQAEYGVSAVGY